MPESIDTKIPRKREREKTKAETERKGNEKVDEKKIDERRVGGDARVVYNAVELHHDATQPLPPPHRAPSLLPASPSTPANPHQYISA